MPEKNGFSEWALVELFGHQKIVGLCSEQVIAGGSMLRVDVPQSKETPPFTRFFGMSAIYSISPISETLARKMAEDLQAEPVQRYDISHLLRDREPQTVEAGDPGF